MNMHAAVISEETTTRETWNAMLDELDEAKRAFDLYDKTEFERTYQYIEKTAPRPDLAFEITARSGQTARYMVWPNDLRAWDDHISAEYRDKAAAIREAWLVHRSLCGIVGWDQICEEQERLCAVQCEVEAKLICTPAPDCAALYWKLDRLFGPDARTPDGFGGSFCAEWINAVMADAHRFLA